MEVDDIMSCEISVSDDGKYIIQIVTGDLTGKLMMEYNLESHALGRELGINRYLVDVTGSRNVDPPTKNFSFARYDLTKAPGIDPSARISTLVSPGDKSHDFIETVCRDRGLDVTHFTDRHQAIRHLLED